MISVDRIWYQQSFLSKILLPFSWLYQFLFFLRRCAYRLGIFKTHRFQVPIIVVGNLTVGGTGKTPLVIALVQILKEQGFHPGVISRGYRGKSDTWPQCVNSNSDPELVGDESVLIAQKTHVPVVAGPKRVNSVRLLLKNNSCDVIVSDDGLQHDALYRDIEIAVIDGERRLGNGYCLPAGPLRESTSRLQSVDFVVVNGGVPLGAEIAMHFVPDALVNLVDPKKRLSLKECRGKQVIAMAGIGNPKRFFDTLRAAGLYFREVVFPDHYQFQKSDIDFGRDAFVVMTEKDAIKCRAFADDRHWMLEGHVELDSNFVMMIIEKLKI